MKKTNFDVLGTMRALRNDKSLTTTQLALLMCAVLRTDNDSMKVRSSLELLAKDANCSEKTARTAFKQPEVLKYFSKVDRQTRSINLWFHPTPVMVTGVDGDVTPVIEGSDSGNSGHDSGNPVPDSGNGYRPSTFTSTSSTTSSTTKTSEAVADAPPSLPLADKGEREVEGLINSAFDNYGSPSPLVEEGGSTLVKKKPAGIKTLAEVTEGRVSEKAKAAAYLERRFNKKAWEKPLTEEQKAEARRLFADETYRPTMDHMTRASWAVFEVED